MSLSEIEVVAETGSTNTDLAARLAAGEHIPEGQWLVADRQTAGKGRLGRIWEGASGNFAGSTVVHPGQGDPPAATLALLTGLALYEAIVPLVQSPQALALKWPNDLNLGDAKLAGILLEGMGRAIIVGIGVNLAEAPDLPDRLTTSIADHAPCPDRDAFAQNLAASFAKELERWRLVGIEPLLRRWQAAAHPRGTSLTVLPPGEQALAGVFDGLTDKGALRLGLADGSTRVIHAGDVMLGTKG